MSNNKKPKIRCVTRYYDENNEHYRVFGYVLGPDGSMRAVSDFVHNPNGPAEFDGYRHRWVLRGKTHREDGPAVIYTDPESPPEWHYFGREYTFDKWCKILKKSDSEIVELKMLYDTSREVSNFWSNVSQGIPKGHTPMMFAAGRSLGKGMSLQMAVKYAEKALKEMK